jgi:mRNA-degrading endonuclease toxin of MazEF toxin-antitoxin module
MIRKSTLNKRAVIIVASSLAAISLTAVLIAAATQKGGRKPLQTRGLLDQARSKKSVITTVVTHSQQQKEKQLLQPQSPWQGSETNKQTATATTTAAAIVSTTNASIDDKDITPPEVVLSSTVPSSTPGSTVIVSSSSSTQTSREEEISVSDEAKKAGESLKELIVTAIKEAKDSATGTGKQLKEQTIDIAAKADSKDIHSLRDNVNVSVGLFEEMMIEIRKERYNEQIKLLDSYKDLLQTHIKVANARRKMASKLKPGS